jgi:hypothetical protein
MALRRAAGAQTTPRPTRLNVGITSGTIKPSFLTGALVRCGIRVHRNRGGDAAPGQSPALGRKPGAGLDVCARYDVPPALVYDGYCVLHLKSDLPNGTIETGAPQSTPPSTMYSMSNAI